MRKEKIFILEGFAEAMASLPSFIKITGLNVIAYTDKLAHSAHGFFGIFYVRNNDGRLTSFPLNP